MKTGAESFTMPRRYHVYPPEFQVFNVLSSAGWSETMQLCGHSQPDLPSLPGRLSLVESISILDVLPRTLGYDRTIVFYNDSEQFHYEQPAGLADFRSGTVCSPNNFAYAEPLTEGSMRISALANYDRWAELDEPAYRLAKARWYDKMVAAAVHITRELSEARTEAEEAEVEPALPPQRPAQSYPCRRDPS